MVYVDEIMPVSKNAPRCFWGGACHLTADTLDELHAMAKLIGMRPSWFQSGSTPHYDLTPKRRQMALDNGAVYKPAKEQARERLIARGLKIGDKS